MLKPICTSRFRLYLPFYIITVFMMGCDGDVQTNSSTNTYFDVKGFMSKEIETMNALKPVVNKKFITEGKTENHSANQINWKMELELFVQADINKPAYSKSYAVSQTDSLHIEYKLNTSELLPVQWLKISLDSVSKNPRKIQALLVSKNRLYESQKNIELECAMVSGMWVVTFYRIKGYQRLMVLDAKAFEIIGKVQFKK